MCELTFFLLVVKRWSCFRLNFLQTSISNNKKLAQYVNLDGWDFGGGHVSGKMIKAMFRRVTRIFTPIFDQFDWGNCFSFASIYAWTDYLMGKKAEIWVLFANRITGELNIISFPKVWSSKQFERKFCSKNPWAHLFTYLHTTASFP